MVEGGTLWQVILSARVNYLTHTDQWRQEGQGKVPVGYHHGQKEVGEMGLGNWHRRRVTGLGKQILEHYNYINALRAASRTLSDCLR